jgi:probable selenium-dependent hydroxylase accessory protein YqeC
MDSDQKAIRSIIEKMVKERPADVDHRILLAEALGLAERDLISLVGAGGKTTLMFRLAKELANRHKKVVTTTTTKILEPTADETPCMCVDRNEERVLGFIQKRLRDGYHATVAAERMESQKLRGIASKFADRLWGSCGLDYLIVEADGAARRPLKAPREQEPVIPSMTTRVVAVLGVDALGMEINAENVFQPDRVSRLTGIPMGGKITDEAMAVLMVHPEGLFKGAPARCRVVAFLNKVDVPQGHAKAKEIAERIVEKRHPQVERVVLGQAKYDPPILDVIFP